MAKKNGTAAIALYLPGIQEHMEFNRAMLKSTVVKVGGTPKITVDFEGRRKGAIEIPRKIIDRELLNEFDKRKLLTCSSISVCYICLHVDTL